MLTDNELDALRLRALTIGVTTYPVVVPALIEEIQRLRQVVRDLAIDRATHEAAER